MKTFRVILYIRAENKDDATELIEDYTGQETDVGVQKVTKVSGDISAARSILNRR